MKKRWLLSYIRNQRKVPGDAGAYELQLIQLGDEEAMARCVTGFDEIPGGSLYLPDSRQPRLIERMAPTMFHDEPYTVDVSGDVPLIPRSVFSACLVARVLNTSNEIPEPVRRWAGETSKATKDPDLLGKVRCNMRQWWKDNETAMRAQNWADVKPGAIMVDPDKTAPAMLNEDAPALPSSKPLSSSQATPKNSPLPSVEACGRASGWIYGALSALAFLLVLAGIGTAIRWRRRQSYD